MVCELVLLPLRFEEDSIRDEVCDELDSGFEMIASRLLVNSLYAHLNSELKVGSRFLGS